MSSILRALKKLENEPRHLEENQSLDSQFVPLADTEPQRSFPGILMMVLGTGIICGLVILAGWWLLSEKSQPPPAVTQKVAQPVANLDKSPASASAFNKATDIAVSEKSTKPSIEAPATPETTEQITAQEPSGFEDSSFQAIDPEDVSTVEVQTPPKAIQVRKTPSLKIKGQVIQPAEKPVAASVNTPAIPPKAVEIEIPKLNDPDMKLQAITWSRTPQKRIVVINNRILREGEVVSGYHIKTINQDDVLLSLDGEKWKLLFR